MATRAWSCALQLRSFKHSVSAFTSPSNAAMRLQKRSSLNSGHVAPRTAGRFTSWRPASCRSEIKPTSSPPQESVTPVPVVDENGKLDGVIQVEREGQSPRPTWGRISALGAGDLVFLLAFAAIGRVSHGFPLLEWDTVRTADPFIAGWFIGSYFIGGYGPEGQGLKGLKVASLAAVKSWAVALPIALAIRGYSIGYIPPTPFIVASLASTFVLQVGWRTAFTALFPNDDDAFQKKLANKKGSPFQFFELLTSLVKRW